MTREAVIQAETMLAIGRLPGVRIFRNNVGHGWVGKIIQRSQDRLLLGHYRPIEFGLFPGSPDLIGWKSVTITEDMVGSTVAVFVGIEMKGKSTATQDNQKTFLNVLETAGAVAGIARSPEDALRLVGSPDAA
jgi:hypothetical protein